MISPLTIFSKFPRLRAILWWALMLAWAGLIFGLSTETFGSSFSGWLLRQVLDFLHLKVSPGAFLRLHFCLRKLAHLTEYAVFSFLLYGCVQDDRPLQWRWRTALWCIALAGAYGFTDEFHQIFVPGRTASLLDCGIDTTGASLGMLALYGNGRLFQARDRKPEGLTPGQ